jgi:hypothetical protein
LRFRQIEINIGQRKIHRKSYGVLYTTTAIRTSNIKIAKSG